MRSVLEQWSTALLWGYRQYSPDSIPDVVRSAGSVLRQGASAEAIAGAEARLGAGLPPSYREFLLMSDGAYGALWHDLGRDLDEPEGLLPVSRVDWSRRYDLDRSTYLLDIEPDPALDHGRSLADRPLLMPIGYREYHESSYLRGGSAEEDFFKAGQAIHSLTIGDWGQQGLLVLNPLTADAAGDWEVVQLHHFGLVRFASFSDWLSHARDRVVEEFAVGAGEPLPPPAPRPRPNPQPDNHLSSDPRVGAVGAAYAAAGALRDALDAHLAASDVGAAAELLSSRANAYSADLIWRLARYDQPEVWRAFESLSQSPDPLRYMSMLAAAITSAPWVPDVASRSVAGGTHFNAFSRVALEMQQTEEAGDRLFALAEEGDLWALRALGRRRDMRALLPALRLLGSPSLHEKLTGAEVLRDLRHPDAVPALMSELDAAVDPEVTIVVAHALAMMRATEAAGLLHQAKGVDRDGEVLCRRWADQLDDAVDE